MALAAALSQYINWPGMLTQSTNNPSFGTRTTLDAAGEYHAIICQARENMTVSHFGFRCGVATGSPTADMRIETVNAADGFPSGTLWATNTNIVTATLTANTWAAHALTASATINRGDIFALKIAYNSGTSFVIGEVTGVSLSSTVQAVNTGTPALAGASFILPWGIGSSSTAMYPMRGFWPLSNVGSTTIASNARRGIRFQVPFPCRAIGAKVYTTDASAGDFNVGIYTDAGSEVDNSITAFDRSQYKNGGSNAVALECYFDNAVTLSANTWYRLAVEATTATTHTMYHVDVSDPALRSGTPGGTNVHLTTYSGSWTDSDTDTVPFIDLIIDQLDDGASVGGGGGQKVYGG